MSLDLDADVVVTEQAPVTSLIQRMGRCNRVPNPRPESGTVLVYRPDDPKPYDDESLIGVNHFLSQLIGKRISQTDLESALQQLRPPPDLPRQCGFLTSAPYAMSRDFSFRDIDEFTVPGLLESDLDDFLQQESAAGGFVVPVPKGTARHRAVSREALPALVPAYLSVIPDELYCEYTGLHA